MEASDVSCAHVRELVSAAADDEITRHERVVVDSHLDRCPVCRTHAERVAALNRQVRLRPAPVVPDLATQVTNRARPPRLGRGGWLRPVLAWVAVAVAAQSIGPFLLGDASGANTHVARHLGAFSLALAVGLLYSAWRPHRAFGLLPFATALVVTMAAGAALDVVGGSSTMLAEAVHVTELVGLVMLWLISGSPGWDRLRSVGVPAIVRPSRG